MINKVLRNSTLLSLMLSSSEDDEALGQESSCHVRWAGNRTPVALYARLHTLRESCGVEILLACPLRLQYLDIRPKMNS